MRSKKDQLDNFIDTIGNTKGGFEDDLFSGEKRASEASLTIEQKKKLHASRTANSGRKKNNARSTKHQVNFKIEQELWEEFQEISFKQGKSFSALIIEGMQRTIEENKSISNK